MFVSANRYGPEVDAVILQEVLACPSHLAVGKARQVVGGMGVDGDTRFRFRQHCGHFLLLALQLMESRCHHT